MAFGNPDPGSNKSAEGILTQIKGLLNQYQGLGDSTPLKAESEAFEKDVDQALEEVKGGGASMHEDPYAPGSGDSSPPDFRSATKAAAQAAKDGNLFGGNDKPKTSDEEQASDDTTKKKRTKAF